MTAFGRTVQPLGGIFGSEYSSNSRLCVTI
jgi:hypothetical protein